MRPLRPPCAAHAPGPEPGSPPDGAAWILPTLIFVDAAAVTALAYGSYVMQSMF